MLILEFIAAALFVASSGLLFNSRFRHDPILVLLAGTIALVSTIFLIGQISNYFAPVEQASTFAPPNSPEPAATAAKQEIESTPKTESISIDEIESNISGWKVTDDGFGFIQIGMSLGDAYVALGLPKIERSDLSIASASLSSCFMASPLRGKIGVSFMIFRGRVVRIEITSEKIRTFEDTGVGSTGDELSARYATNLTIQPHPYVVDGKYFVVKRPLSENELIFEVIHGRVATYRVGSLPAVAWIEHCL